MIAVINMRVMTTTNRSDSVPAVASSMIPKVPVTLDTKGRVRTSKEQRRVILEEFERSGESAAGFAKRTGLKYSTLAGWLVRYRRPKAVRHVQPLRRSRFKGERATLTFLTDVGLWHSQAAV